MKNKRNIYAKFSISEDSNLSGVVFYSGNKKTQWEDLTHLEQVKMLNSWAGMYRLFYEHVKED